MRSTTTSVEDIKLLVASRLDVTEFLEVLGWDMYELVEQLDPQVFEEFDTELLDACGER